MKLDQKQFEDARDQFLGQQSEELIGFMADQSLQDADKEYPEDIRQCARDLGWIDPDTGKRTVLGVMISDSCREYRFWANRAKRLPFEDALPHLSRATFVGKYVVEIGAGMGANLMSLSGTARKLCGVEPVEAYVQIGQILREREGIADVDIRAGRASNLPFRDGEVDLVLCVSAHQYFDLAKAMPEIARVVRPGGELIVIGNTLGGFVSRVGRRLIRRRGGGLKHFAMTVANTLGYQAFGRRLLANRSAFTTARPIYPTSSAMLRWMGQAGFSVKVAPQPANREACFYMRRKPKM